MVSEKIDLLVFNDEELRKSCGIFTNSSFRKCAALSLTLRGIRANSNRITESIKIIKENTIVFSNFRGNNLLNVAVTISLTNNMTTSFREINAIYERLKKNFFSNEYLVLAAQIIFNSRDNIDIYKAIDKTKYVYDSMKKNHWFLTGHEDISAAAMIAITSENLDKTLEEIEEQYKILKEYHIFGGNKLQNLSHILVLFNGDVSEKAKKVSAFTKELSKYNIRLNSYAYPLIGVSAFITGTPKQFAEEVKDTIKIMKEKYGFGTFSMSSNIRNMFAIGIVASKYSSFISDEESLKIINTTNNITLNIQLVIQIAAASVAAGAAAAASASN